MIKVALYYNHNALGDTIILVKDALGIPYTYEKCDDVVVIKDVDNNIIGINIFNTLEVLKIKANGLVHALSAPVAEVVKDLVYQKTQLEIEFEHNSYTLGIVDTVYESFYEVDIGSATIKCPKTYPHEEGDYVIVATSEERLDNGYLVKEVTSYEGYIVTTATDASDDDIGKKIY